MLKMLSDLEVLTTSEKLNYYHTHPDCDFKHKIMDNPFLSAFYAFMYPEAKANLVDHPQFLDCLVYLALIVEQFYRHYSIYEVYDITNDFEFLNIIDNIDFGVISTTFGEINMATNMLGLYFDISMADRPTVILSSLRCKIIDQPLLAKIHEVRQHNLLLQKDVPHSVCNDDVTKTGWRILHI